MTTTGEPLSDARLAEIRRKQGRAWLNGDPWQADYRSDVADLLAEVDRLRAREAALLAVAHATANADDNGYGACVMCGQQVRHANEPHNAWCPAGMARSLLASEQPDAPGRE